MAVKILFENSPNLRHWRNYHFDTAISISHYQVFYAPFRDLPKTNESNNEDIDRILLMKLVEIEGLECIQIQPYRLGVQVGLAFDWVPILAQIEQILTELFNKPIISPLL